MDHNNVSSTGSDGSECWSIHLRNLLDVVEPLGTFATVSDIPSLAFPLPMVTVQGVGKLAFPLMEVAVEPLKAVSEKAPFGKGTETVQDDNVRKAWQMDASQVSLGGGDAWDKALQSIIDAACHELGFSKRRIQQLGIQANLYKLLLYETGGHFTPHQDTEKEAGMFGTMVIQLPSRFTGGELSVCHNAETKMFDLADHCEEQFKCIAFYTDCEHQLHPITSGVRICLVFNLVATTLKQDYMALEGEMPEGPIATTGTIEAAAYKFPFPGVIVEGVGTVDSIVSSDLVERLKSVSSRVPVGQSSEGSSGVWKVGSSQISMSDSEEWEEYLDVIVQLACKQLGFSLLSIVDLGFCARLKGLFLYENSETFTPNKDSERGDGTFGSLLIQWPSNFVGGHVTMTNQSESMTLDGLDTVDGKFHYIASYWNVVPHFHPVSRGIRFCLQFDLAAASPKKVYAPSHSVNVETECQLRSIATRWKADKNCEAKLGYRLGHQYSPRSFAFSALKGRDSILVRLLLEARSSEGRPLFEVHLLLMERYVYQYFGEDPKTDVDKVRARLVLGQNGVVYKADYGWYEPPKDLESEYELESDESVDHLEPRMYEDDQESDKDLEEESYSEDDGSYSDEDNGYLEDAMEQDRGKTKGATESMTESTAKVKDDKDDDMDVDLEKESNEKVENWNMRLHKDGWLKLERVADAKNVKGAVRDETDDEESVYDFHGNPLRPEHKMFRGMNKRYIEPHYGNSAGTMEQWYYTAAVVISLAKD
jgi:2OG-Fe(II) oxygenase superfamily